MYGIHTVFQPCLPPCLDDVKRPSMAKNSPPPPAAKPKSGNGATNGSAAAAEKPESLDQVRDILFGGQMRMVDARLQSLEERIVLEQTALRNDLGKRIAELEDASKKEFAAHAERLSAERNKRADDLKSLSAELKEMLKNLERRHVKFEEATALADAEVREAKLRTDKVDATTLVATLNDMAAKVTAAVAANGGARPPNKGNSK